MQNTIEIDVTKMLMETQGRIAILEREVENIKSNNSVNRMQNNNNNNKGNNKNNEQLEQELKRVKQSLNDRLRDCEDNNKRLTSELTSVKTENNNLKDLNEGLVAENERLKNENNNLLTLAYVDVKTNVNNENAFNRDISKFKGSIQDMNLVVFSISDQKLVNNTYGRKAGDKRIKFVADYLSKKIDSDIYRVFGDRFYIIDKDKSITDELIEEITSELMTEQINVNSFIVFGEGKSKLGELISEIDMKCKRQVEKPVKTPKRQVAQTNDVQPNIVEDEEDGVFDEEEDLAESDNTHSRMDKWFPKQKEVERPYSIEDDEVDYTDDAYMNENIETPHNVISNDEITDEESDIMGILDEE